MRWHETKFTGDLLQHGMASALLLALCSLTQRKSEVPNFQEYPARGVEKLARYYSSCASSRTDMFKFMRHWLPMD
jgi:hypothetical protein